jgi:hypothetical protein
MSSSKTEIANETRPTTSNPLDVVPSKITFDVPYGLPISLYRAQAVIHAAVAEAKKRNWKMNVAVADSAVTWSPSSEWMARCLPQFRSRNTGREQP